MVKVWGKKECVAQTKCLHIRAQALYLIVTFDLWPSCVDPACSEIDIAASDTVDLLDVLLPSWPLTWLSSRYSFGIPWPHLFCVSYSCCCPSSAQRQHVQRRGTLSGDSGTTLITSGRQYTSHTSKLTCFWKWGLTTKDQYNIVFKVIMGHKNVRYISVHFKQVLYSCGAVSFFIWNSHNLHGPQTLLWIIILHEVISFVCLSYVTQVARSSVKYTHNPLTISNHLSPQPGNPPPNSRGVCRAAVCPPRH